MCRFIMLGAWHHCSSAHILQDTSLYEAVEQATKVILLFLGRCPGRVLHSEEEKGKAEAKQRDIRSLSEITHLYLYIIIKLVYCSYMRVCMPNFIFFIIIFHLCFVSFLLFIYINIECTLVLIFTVYLVLNLSIYFILEFNFFFVHDLAS